MDDGSIFEFNCYCFVGAFHKKSVRDLSAGIFTFAEMEENVGGLRR